MSKFVATSDFDWNGKTYKKGDEFKPPADYTRDVSFEEFRNIDSSRGNLGIPFYYEIKIGDQRNPKTNKMEPVMDTRRVVLPLQEA